MNIIIKPSGRVELIPEGDEDRHKLARVPEGTNEVFVWTTLDGGADGNQEALVIAIGEPASYGRTEKEAPAEVVNWIAIETLIKDLTVSPITRDYWSEALKFHEQGLPDIDVVKRLGEVD